jgi:hypothetical protein
MRKLAFLFVAFALVAVSFYGCDEKTPTEPASTVGALFSAEGNSAGLSSTFDSGNEGWTLVGDAYRAWSGTWMRSLYPEYASTGGNPGGAVYATDMARGIYYYWQAPPKYLGNQLGAYGGALLYDVKTIGTGDPTDGTDVVLAGDGKTLLIRLDPNVGPDWTTVRVNFTEDAGWRHEDPNSGTPATAEDLKAVLKDLTVLHIRGEYLAELDVGYLDNVRIIPKGQAK